MRVSLVLVAALALCSALDLRASFSVASDGVPAALFQFERVDVKGLHVLTWDSAALRSSFHADFLRIVDTATGAVLPFEGASARYSTRPSPASYVALNERSQFEVSFKHDYPLVAGRTYHITPRLTFADTTTQPASGRTSDLFVPATVNITSAPVVWHYNPRNSDVPAVVADERNVEAEQAAAGIKIVKCTNTETNMVHEGWNEGVKQITAGKASIEATSPEGGPLYVTWFGARDAKRLQRARQVITVTHAWFGYENATANCKGAECTADTYAYVFVSDRTMTVYLCGAYWSSPLYEQGNTWTHEVAHFNYIGRTNDYAYGQSACKSLAKSNPARAVENSDNFAYFCEEANNGKK